MATSKKNLQGLLSKSNKPKSPPGKLRSTPGTSTVVPSLKTLRQQPEPDPLAGVNYHQPIEQAAAEELSTLLAGFKARAGREDERFELATDSATWCCIAFQSRQQKEAFLKALNWLPYGDKYLDGVALAQQSGIDIGEVALSDPVKKSPDKKLLQLTRKKRP